jgi:hypothetical protein
VYTPPDSIFKKVPKKMCGNKEPVIISLSVERLNQINQSGLETINAYGTQCCGNICWKSKESEDRDGKATLNGFRGKGFS